MSKWIESEISKIGTVVSGGTPSTTNSKFWNGDILFVTPYDLSRNKTAFIENTERKISREGLENSSANLLPIGSIILSSRAPIGYIAIAKKEFTTNQGCKSIIPNSDFDSEYFYYCFHFYVERIKKYGEGTTFAEISKGDLELVKFPHPKDKTEQRQIATILSTADAVIEKTQAAIAKYKAIKQGMLQDLFTRGLMSEKVKVKSEKLKVRNEKWEGECEKGEEEKIIWKLRPSYQDAPELYKESKLGWIPREWEVERIDKFGEIVTGSTPPTANREYYGDDFLFVSPGDIQDGIFISNTEKKLTKSGFDICRQLPTNSICVVCIGSTIGKIALLEKEGCTNQQINSVICYDMDLSFYYFYAMLYYHEKQFRKETGLQAVPIVNKNNFSKFVFPILVKKEALEISLRLKTIDKKLQTEQDFLHKQQQIKAGLMGDLLSGKKRVEVKEALEPQTGN